MGSPAEGEGGCLDGSSKGMKPGITFTPEGEGPVGLPWAGGGETVRRLNMLEVELRFKIRVERTLEMRKLGLREEKWCVKTLQVLGGCAGT